MPGPRSQPLLTAENYEKGFLVDDTLLGGITPDPETPGRYCAYVLNQETGEYLGFTSFPTLDDALAQLNAVERSWAFESTKGCGGGGSCGAGEGACGTEACPKGGDSGCGC